MLIFAGNHIAGVDEVGRGPLAGPVVASAVILNFEHWDEDLQAFKDIEPNQPLVNQLDSQLDPQFFIDTPFKISDLNALNDSKKLTAKNRDMLYDRIMAYALSVGVGSASAEEIDEMNILQASFLAMKRAIENLTVMPSEVWVDGNQLPKKPKWSYPSTAITGGDAKVLEIAAASIIAKVTRDRWMQKLDQTYPGYGFAENAGYPTVLHRNAILKLGVTPQHRQSFGPVREYLKINGEC